MRIIGHRGARGLSPENTIASLEKALEHHVDELEFDLRVTKDNVAVLHHDAQLTEPDGTRHGISDHDYQYLKRRKPDLATFPEVLDRIGHPVILHVEVKRRVRVGPIVKIIRERLKSGWKPEYFLLGSKSQKTLLELHAALPEIEKVVIEPWSGVRASRRARQVGATRISMNQLWLWGGFIRMVSRSGRKLSAYPLNDPRKARRWAKSGLHGAITDYPDRFDSPPQA